jgi:hypothetical protein
MLLMLEPTPSLQSKYNSHLSKIVAQPVINYALIKLKILMKGVSNLWKIKT